MLLLWVLCLVVYDTSMLIACLLAWLLCCAASFCVTLCFVFGPVPRLVCLQNGELPWHLDYSRLDLRFGSMDFFNLNDLRWLLAVR
jgi:hypothetical protein